MSAIANTSLISEKVSKEIDRWLTQYPPEQKRSGLLYALRLVQEQNGGWLSTELLNAVGDYLGLQHAAVYEVATFYKMYELAPVGRHKIAVCNSISCMLRGSADIIEHVEHKLGIKEGESTSDGLFYLREVECLAACVSAPVMQVDDREYHENVTIQKVDALIEQIRQAEAKYAK
jgi:NADH-quinone oxidoreductase subunit E